MRRLIAASLVVFAVLAVFLATVASCGGTRASTPPSDAGPDAVVVAEAGAETGSSVDASDASDASSDAHDAAVEATVIPGTNFAFRHYYLGDTDRMGTMSSAAWSSFGANIDGKITTAASTDVCTLTAGASKQTQADGAGGIDNSWGANILPIFLTIFGSTFSTSYNDAVAAGDFTTMIDVTGLSDSGTQTGSAPGWGFAGSNLGHPPTWTVADDWPVYPDWLNDGGLASGSQIAFPGATITAGAWSSGTPTVLPIEIGFSGVGVDLVLHDATVSFLHATPTTTAGGTVSGVLFTQELLTTLQDASGWLTMALCSGSAFQSIAQQIEQAQDIMHDGTNVAGQSCDAISIGIGFDGVQIGPVDRVDFPQGQLPNICPDQ
ncbi:MAG TPA: hypothetical protein VIJ22_07675 [Polyangiaceae bacterium]